MERPGRPISGRSRRSRGLALGVIALMAASLGGAPAMAQDPNVLKVATTANITTWDPVASFSTEAFYMGNIYEPLLWINPPGAAEEFTPALATTWSHSDDGLTWTFEIRPDVTFHDGSPLTADAVVASIEAARTRAGASFIWAPLDTITATGPLTVEMRLKYAAPMDLVASSLYGAWIVSPASLEAANELYATDPAADHYAAGIDGGTGPYTIESYTPDSEVLLTAYPEYWGGWEDVDHYDKVLVSIIPESINQQQALDGGDVDIAFNVPAENLSQYEDDPDFTVLREPSFFNYVGLFNTQKAPLDDPKVREALSYAIPYADVITVGAQGAGTQSRGPVPAGVFPYDETVPQYTYDIDKAKTLLAEAGYPDGGFPMEITYASENQNEARFAPLIQDSFEQLGIDVTLTPMLFNQQWERAKGDPAGRQDMFLLLYWPTYSDAGADNMWSLFHSSEAPFFNLSYWNDPTYDQLIDTAGTLTATDRDAAQAGYSEALNRLVEQAPGVYLYDTQFVAPIPNRIAGYDYNLNYPFAQFFYPLHPAE